MKAEDFERHPESITEVRNWAEKFMMDIFESSQENLIKLMPWGDYSKTSDRKPTIISDTGLLLQSGVPPYWKHDKIHIEYTAPHAGWVEFGTEAHYVPPEYLMGWVRRKLGIRGKNTMEVAQRVAWKIYNHGIAPHPFLRPAIHEMISKHNLKIRGPRL